MTKQNYQKNETPYEKAYIEWADRIGQTRAQLKNWRLVAVLSMLLTLLLLIVLMMVMSAQKTYVYVAEIRPNETVGNKVLLPERFNATQAQESYFIGQFINNIMTLPLDPVVARQNWFDAYNMVSGEAIAQLTSFAQANDPFTNLGAETKSVQINSINAVSDQSIQVTWSTTTYNSQGVVQDQATYNGVFTLSHGPNPTTTSELLKNPFGLKVSYFSINREG